MNKKCPLCNNILVVFGTRSYLWFSVDVFICTENHYESYYRKNNECLKDTFIIFDSKQLFDIEYNYLNSQIIISGCDDKKINEMLFKKFSYKKINENLLHRICKTYNNYKTIV